MHICLCVKGTAETMEKIISWKGIFYHYIGVIFLVFPFIVLLVYNSDGITGLFSHKHCTFILTTLEMCKTKQLTTLCNVFSYVLI